MTNSSNEQQSSRSAKFLNHVTRILYSVISDEKPSSGGEKLLKRVLRVLYIVTGVFITLGGVLLYFVIGWFGLFLIPIGILLIGLGSGVKFFAKNGASSSEKKIRKM